MTGQDGYAAGRKGIRFSPEVSLGQALQAAVVIIGVVIWFVTGQTKADQTSVALSTFKAETTSQFTQIHQSISDVQAALTKTVTDSSANVQAQIANLPDQRAAIKDLQRRASGYDARFVTDEQVIRQVQRDTDRNTVSINAIETTLNASGFTAKK